jgi:transcriptional regulator with XRE-family HTH domain
LKFYAKIEYYSVKSKFFLEKFSKKFLNNYYMTVRERLIRYLKYKKISQSAFEKSVNLSNGYVNNIRKSIQPDKIQRIALQYQDLNAGWLLTGEGEMLRNGNAENSESRNTEKSEYISYRELYEQAKEEISQLHETVGRLKAENEIHKQSDNPDKD